MFLSPGVATSQSIVLNGQVQLGEVVSSQTLDVVSATDDTTAVTTATGNNFTGAVENDSVDVTSTQDLQGNVTAQTIVNVTDYSGANLNVSNAATGNTGDAGIAGGGTMTGSFTQTTSAVDINSHVQINATDGQSDRAAIAGQAFANSQGFGVTDSVLDVSVNQTSAANVQANGGAEIGWQPFDGSYSNAAVANNVTSTSAGTSTQAIAATQTNTGPTVQATMFTAFGTSQNTVTSATASGNNANLTNTGGSLDVTANQDNQAYVRAQAEETSFDFGGASAVAYGVGNSVLAGTYSPALWLDNTQTNSGGGTEAVASFSGNNGYDVNVSATAMGNAVTGFACSTCGGMVDVANSQTNSSDVGATATTTIGLSGRSVRGTATAVGNSASFYVTSPTQ